MKIQLADKLVETKEVTINNYKEIWFRVNKDQTWYKSPYKDHYTLISELSKLSKLGITEFLQLIQKDK